MSSAFLIDYRLTSEWNGGFTLEFYLTNQSESSLNGYQLDFGLDAKIDALWGADSYLTTEAGYRIDNDIRLAPGETTRIKIKALGDETVVPISPRLNGEEIELTDGARQLTEAHTHPDLLGDDYPFSDNAITVDNGIDAATLNALIAAAPEGATIHLAAGRYVFDESLAIERSDITLAGAGSDTTTLVFSQQALASDSTNAIRVSGKEEGVVATLAIHAQQGDTRIELSEGHGLEVGDTIRLSQPNDATFLDAIGDIEWRETDSPLRTSMAQIVAIDGNQVVLDRGIHFDLDAGVTEVEQVEPLTDVRLEGMSVAFTLGEPDDSDFSNTLPALSRYHAVEFNATVGATMKDVEVVDGPSVAFEFSRSLDLDVADITATGSFNKGSDGNGYAYELRESYDGHFSGLVDSGMRHSVLFASWHSSVGNDLRVTSTDRDINFHGGRDHGNTVYVGQSIRDADNDAMSTTVWTNAGEAFGAPTEENANLVTFDYAIGSRRDDVIHASDDGAYLDGALGNDTLLGGNGDDILGGGGGWGENILDGGAGDDTALFIGALSDYDIERLSDDKWHVAGNGSDDTLSDIERALFADGQLMDLATGAISQVEAPGNLSPEHYWASRESLDTSSVSSLHATFDVVSRWSSGYVMGITITNEGDSAVTTDHIALTIPSDIHTLYGASLVAQQGDEYHLDIGSRTLESGDAMRFSFKAYADTSEIPREIFVGDQAATIDEGSLPDGSRLAEALVDADRVVMATGSGSLVGGSGNDILTGSPEDDILMGSLGADRLEGGGGQDRFVWQAAMESTPLSIDEVLDFCDNDLIDLSSLDANTSQEGQQAFQWQGEDSFTGEAGQLRFANNQLQGDINGDGLSDLVIGFQTLDQLDPGQLILS
ncbi:cellulose binding domain-containing protein [Salinicola rhizosphaerae]|uniref:CBM2 domain-containing protein n=1 Tax=Salinicola rhizosphaerae TaxID=1443141 RepID=A0ABQ3E6F2_9GAMM|nr:cellulose binding domain-containing protein [Salinicola rhizosphaerae]GHB24646.1 hypothetical protein GCM10009038_24660 [Salinicola rhizosphaerae]